MSRFIFDTAKDSDDPALQKILRDNPMAGDIQLTFRRKPSYFEAAEVEGTFLQVVVGRETESGRIVGFGARSIKRLYVNGDICNVGYLNNLRLNKEYRGGTLVARGYNYFRELHKDGRASIYITTIGEKNEYAKKILAKQRAKLPTYYDFGLYHSIAVVFSKRKKRIKKTIEVVKNTGGYTEAIIECIHRNGSLKQFYPHYTIDDVISNKGLLRGLRQEDFYVALESNRVVGVLAKWDQRDFKQSIVTSYKGKMKVLKPICNMWAKLFGYSTLPVAGSEISCFYASLIAVDANDSQIFRALLHKLCNDSIGEGYACFIIGFHSRDPLLKVAKQFFHIDYQTRLYIVCWEDGEHIYRSLDNRIPYLEIGTL